MGAAAWRGCDGGGGRWVRQALKILEMAHRWKRQKTDDDPPPPPADDEPAADPDPDD